MIWHEPKNHCQDFYFCLTKTKGFSFKQRDKITYPNLDSARTPVPHNDSMPPPVPPQYGLNATDNSADEHNSDGLTSFNYSDSDTTEDPILFSQKHLNDLIRDLLYRCKKKAELLASRLKERNMVEKDVKVSYYRKRNRGLSSAFFFCIFFIHTLSFSLKILEQLVMSRVKDLTKTSKLWKKGIK